MKKLIVKLMATAMLLGVGFVAAPVEKADAAQVQDGLITTQSYQDPGDVRP
jgi:hypothetical protein